MADTDDLAELRDIAPSTLDGFEIAAEACAALAVGLTLALVVAAVVRLFTARHRSQTENALRALSQTRDLPPRERVFAQAALLRTLSNRLATDQAKGDWLAPLEPALGAEFFVNGPGAGLRDALYRKDATFDAEAFDAALSKSFSAGRW